MRWFVLAKNLTPDVLCWHWRRMGGLVGLVKERWAVFGIFQITQTWPDPVQLRLAYVSLLVCEMPPGMNWFHPIPLVGTTTMLVVTGLAQIVKPERCKAAIERRSDEHREVILLRDFQGISTDDAGERMQASSRAIRNLVFGALAEPGKRLKPGEESLS